MDCKEIAEGGCLGSLLGPDAVTRPPLKGPPWAGTQSVSPPWEEPGGIGS